MKLVRYGDAGAEKPGLLDADGSLRDLSSLIPDIDGDALGPERLHELGKLDPKSLPEVPNSPRLGPCVGSVGKFICIGLNYSDHAAESGMAVPAEPVIFMKATSAICGAHDEVTVPRNSTKMDWEVELGVVIGKRASYVEESEALSYVQATCEKQFLRVR